MNNDSTCGTQLTTSNNLYVGDAGLPNTTLSYIPAPTGYTYPLSWTYTYTTDPRVAALEAKVEVLEKMLAALLSGRDLPPKRRKA